MSASHTMKTVDLVCIDKAIPLMNPKWFEVPEMICEDVANLRKEMKHEDEKETVLMLSFASDAMLRTFCLISRNLLHLRDVQYQSSKQTHFLYCCERC